MLPILALYALGCATDPGGGPATDTGGGTTDGGADSGADGGAAVGAIDPQAWVARASVDMRGRRPTSDELALATDEAAASALIQGFVDDPDLPLRMAWLYDDHLRTAVFFDNSPTRVWEDLSDAQRHALGWAPLELLRLTVEQDLPLSNLVTATQLPRNDDVAAVFSWTPTGSGDAWVLAPHEDGRPRAGLLSSSELWFVYDGDTVNFNRRRANAISRLFLCEDLLARDISFDFDLSVEDLQALETAVRTEPSCLTCHAALDPLAATLGGFAERSVERPRDQLAEYSPYMAEWYTVWTAPAWFGTPVADLEDVGAQIAADPRFARCGARVFAEGLVGRGLAEAVGDAAAAEQLLDEWAVAFRDQDGLRLRPLVGRIVQSAAYRAADERTLRPEALPSVLADLLGLAADDPLLEPLAWSTEHRLLGGSTDDAEIIERNAEPGLGHHVLFAWVGRGVSMAALEADAGRSADARVLWTEAPPWDVDADAVRDQLAAWHDRFLSQPVQPEAEEITRLYALWQAAGGDGDPETAWATVVEALIRHPRFLLY